MPLNIRRSSEVGGGPAGGAGQVHADPHKEFGSAEHTHTMSPLEIGIMVGVIVVFGTVIGTLFFYRARKIKKTQVDQEGGSRPGTQDGAEIEDKDVVKGGEVSSGSFRQLFGRKWLGLKRGKSALVLSLAVPSLTVWLRDRLQGRRRPSRARLAASPRAPRRGASKALGTGMTNGVGCCCNLVLYAQETICIHLPTKLAREGGQREGVDGGLILRKLATRDMGALHVR